MSDLADFFNKDKLLIRKVIAGGSTNGRIVQNQQPNTSNQRGDSQSSSEYAEEHRLNNQQQLFNVIIISVAVSRSN